ncbi:unnamed protein product, partial [Staurois parvus]
SSSSSSSYFFLFIFSFTFFFFFFILILSSSSSLAMGPCTASSCCCQARNLPWAPVPPPHAAARSRVCHGSLVPPPIAAVSIATLCHVPLSGLLTLLVGFHFV